MSGPVSKGQIPNAVYQLWARGTTHPFCASVPSLVKEQYNVVGLNEPVRVKALSSDRHGTDPGLTAWVPAF